MTMMMTTTTIMVMMMMTTMTMAVMMMITLINKVNNDIDVPATSLTWQQMWNEQVMENYSNKSWKKV